MNREQQALAAGQDPADLTVEGIVTKVLSRRAGGAIFVIEHPGTAPRTSWRIRAAPNTLPAPPLAGEHWSINGRLEEHPDYGQQLLANACFRVRPTADLLIDFLAANPRFAGIGKKTARHLWKVFGETLFTILDVGDITALTDRNAGGLSPSLAEHLVAAWRSYPDEKPVVAWLVKHNFPAKLARRVLQFFGDIPAAAIGAIGADPYLLLPLAGWRQVDEVARTLGVADNDPRRLAAAAEDTLYSRYDRGHTGIDLQNDPWQKWIQKRLGDSCDPREAVRCVLKDRAVEIVYSPNAVENGLLQLSAAYTLEEKVRRRLVAMSDDCGQPSRFTCASELNEATVYAFEQRNGFALNERQRDAVRNALAHPVSCILGGAGVGKTTVLAAIYDQLNRDIPILQMALTGRAAKRMHDATGREASTIHSFLARSKTLGVPRGAWVVVDEASMLDVPTIYGILKALPDDVHLCFVGDPHQLPPIGPGLAFHAMAWSERIPKVELTQVHRQAAATGIPAVAEALLARRIPPLDEFVGLRQKNYGVSFVDAAGPREIQRWVLRAYRECVRQGGVQIVAARNSTCHAINIALHNEHYQDRRRQGVGVPLAPIPGKSMTVEDPVLHHSRNDYPRGLYNGSLGVLTQFYDQARAGLDEYGQETLYVAEAKFDEAGPVPLTAEDFQYLDLGYAISVHKSQGTQFERVVVVCEDTNLVDNSWLYTALTRAQRQVIIIGNRHKFRAEATSTPRAFRRVHGLKL